MIVDMAKKRDIPNLGTWTFGLLVAGMLGTAALAIFDFGKDVGRMEERVAQLERNQALEPPSSPP